MDRLLNRLKRLNWCKVALILILAYFSQVYPYVHFHHSHDESAIPIEISLHPPDVDIDGCTDHHEDGHHHHTFDQGTDWYAVRQGVRHIVLTADWSSLVVEGISLSDIEPRSSMREYADDIFTDSVPLDSFLSRGPPTLT